MEKVEHLLVGGGLAAAKCAENLRKQGSRGRILIIGAEADRPYNRPPLSKGLLLGYADPESVFVHSADFYEKHDIELLVGDRASSLDAVGRVVKTENGREFTFEKLLIATGTTPRRLNVDGGGLGNIFYLRALGESLAIREAVKSSKNALIVGAGFIGMELASAFAQNGLTTTMLVRDDGLFTRLGSPLLSKFFEDLYIKEGIHIIYNDSVSRFEGAGRVERAITAGGQDLPCDLAAVGIGVTPETGWLKESGLELDNGVEVNQYLESSVVGIFAAGDVADYYDPIFEKKRRVEHWDNAIEQGKVAAVNMLGARQAYTHVPFFFSDLFDLSWEWLGDNSQADETLVRGALDERSAIIFYLKDNRLVGAFLLMQGEDERLWTERAIIDRTDISLFKGRLADQSIALVEAG